jgi:hypothetical protein
MHTTQMIGSSLLVLAMAGTALAQGDSACGRVRIHSVERNTIASAMTFDNDFTTDEGDWESNSSAMKRFGGEACYAKQKGWVDSDSFSLDLDTKIKRSADPTSCRSEVVVKFSVDSGPDWWEEYSIIEPGTDPVLPIKKDYTRVELDLVSDLMARGGGSSLNPGATSRVIMQLIGNGVYLENEVIDGRPSWNQTSLIDRTISLDPGNYKLVFSCESAWSPELLQGPGGSISWGGNSGYAICEAELELNFRETLDPGKAFVEVIDTHRGANAHVEGYFGHSSGTTSVSYPCAGSLYWDAGSGGNYSEASQESQIRSSAFWGEFNVNANSYTSGRETSSWTNMRVDFRTYGRTLAQIDIRSWATAFRFLSNSVAKYSLEAKIIDLATGNVVSQRTQVISSPGVPSFDTDMDTWNVVLDPEHEYRFYVKVKAEAENKFFMPASTMILGTGYVKIAFAPFI